MGLVALVAVVLFAVQAGAATQIYVDAAGVGGPCSDARGAAEAASPTTPLCSVGRALQVAPAASQVVVRAGSYPQINVSSFSRPDYVTVQAYPGERVAVAGVQLRDVDHLRVQGFTVTTRFDVTGSDHDVQVVGNDIGNQRSGLFVYGEGGGSTNITISGNTIHDIDYPEADSTASGEGYGIQMIGNVSNVAITGNTIRSVVEDYVQGGGTNISVSGNTFLGPSRRYGHSELVHADLWQIFGSSSQITFANNVARNTGTQNGLLFQFSSTDQPHRDIRIVNNVFDHASDGTEMQIYNTTGLLIANNTAIGSKDGVLIRKDDRVAAGSNYRIVDNIFQSNQNTSISQEVNWGVEDYNIIVHPGFASRGAFGPHDLVGRSPTFVDAGAGDYHLAPGSIGIDAGTPDGATAADIEGFPRGGKPDIGAYEWHLPGAGSANSESAPALSRLKVVPKRFKVARGRLAKRRGTTLRFTLSKAARVRFTFQRRVSGRRVGKRCLAPTRARRRHGSCRRWVRVAGTFTVAKGNRGANKVRFTGRVAKHWLKRGHYVAYARAISGNAASAPLAVSFVVTG
jgi:hypothetical protein